MAPASVLTGEWATAEDTARALGVSDKRLKRIKELAALALGKASKKSGIQKSSVRPSKNGSVVARSFKSTRVRNSKSSGTAKRKAGAVRRAKS